MSRFFSGFGRFRERSKEIPPAFLSSPTESSTIGAISDDNTVQSSQTLSKISDRSPLKEGVLSSIASKLKRTPDYEFELHKDFTLDDRMGSLRIDCTELEERCKFDVKEFNRKHGLSESASGYVIGDVQSCQNYVESATLHAAHTAVKSPDHVIASLKKGYFQEDFDPAREQILKFVGILGYNQYLPSPTCEEYSNDGMKDVNLSFMEALEEADTDRDMINKRLASLIHNSQPEITESQNGIFSIDVDIARAVTQISISRRRMNCAKDFISNGFMKINELLAEKMRLKWMLQCMDDFYAFSQLSSHAKELALNGDYYGAISSVYELLSTYQDKNLEQFDIVLSIRNGLLKSVPLIRGKADKVLESISRRCFDSRQYSNIICTYMIIDFMIDDMGINISGECVDEERMKSARRKSSATRESSISDTVHRKGIFRDILKTTNLGSEYCIEELANSISKYQCQDIGNCMKSTVMECISLNGGKNEKPDSHTEVDENMQLEDTYRLITPNVAVQCVLRCCELVCEAVHTHYLITQWHRSPFDKRNSKQDYLHRYPAVLSHEEEFLDNLSEDAQSSVEAESSSAINCDVMERNNELYFQGSHEDTRDFYNKYESVYANEVHNRKQLASEHIDIADKEEISQNTETSHETQELYNRFIMNTDENFTPQVIDVENLSLSSSFLSKTDTKNHSVDELETCWRRFRDKRNYLHIDLTQLEGELLGKNSLPVLSRIDSLKHAYAELYKSRVELWEYVEKSMHLLLKNIVITSFVALDDFLTMSWALNELVRLGFEFCRARSKALSSCIAEKSSLYFSQIHKDSFVMLRQVMEAEPWKCLPMDVADLGGVCGAVKMNLSRSQITTSNKEKIHIKGLLKPRSKPTIIEDNEEREDELLYRLEKKRRIDDGNILTSFVVDGNPFCIVAASETKIGVCTDEEGDVDIASILDDLFDDDETFNEEDEKISSKQMTSIVVTQSSLKGLSNFTGKYVQLMYVVKTMSTNIFRDLCQLFDFYICSVFKGFVPESQKERLLYYTKKNAPPPDTAKDFEALKIYAAKAFENRVPGQAESEINESSASGAMRFVDVISIVPNQFYPRDKDHTNLIGTSCALNEHLVAAESCWFAARILKDMKSKFLRLLPPTYHQECSQYIAEIQCIVGQLQSLIYRGICPELCSSNEVLSKIQECSWAGTRKQNENDGKANDWVDVLVSNCEEVWKFLNEENEYSVVHEIARDQAWMELCQAAFDITLDGFSDAKKTNVVVGSNTTSSEKCRNAMINDLNILQSSLDKIRSCRPARGKEHVEEYVRATGLNEEDMMQWVRENWQMYAYRHMNALITQTMASVMKKTKLKESLIELDNLYDQDQKFHSPVKTKTRRTVLGIKLPGNG